MAEKINYAIKRYTTGKYSAEQAAKYMGINLWNFFDLLKNRKIQISYDLKELEEDLANL